MKILRYNFLLISIFIASPLFAQDSSKDLARINMEGFHNSHVMQLITDLSDLHGPRLNGSRKYYEAAEWAKKTMESWGLNNVHFEQYCDDCMGWEVHSFNVEMTAPNFLHIMSYPYAWTLGSNGEKEADLVWIKDYHNLDEVKQNWTGKLQGKMVLIGDRSTKNLLFDPLSKRLTEDELDKASKNIDPNKSDIAFSAGGTNFVDLLKMFEEFLHEDNAFFKFLKDQGAIGVMDNSDHFPSIAHPSGTYNFRKDDDKTIPYFSIAAEHFGTLTRLIDRGITPKIKFHSDAELYLEPKNAVDIIAEIPGGDPKLKNEVVMVGGHFDSWHGGAGSTDNGAGSAVMMEVMRILKASGVKPRRTIRIGLWGGEEQGFLGSLGYCQKHFGMVGQPHKQEAQTISAYLNLDNGAGQIRGIYLQGNEAVRPIFKKMLEPYSYLDVNHLTIENTDFTDHDVFDYYNIPAFQFIQDPLNYIPVTHHTTMDVLDYVPERDMTINATVIAAMVYQIAMRDEQIPRKQ